ncbi:hybrid sensor histidine kinase/response regulator [Crocosphaera sp. UHCC 0190]|uniref:hybrid sensor histidine kinase/response regulator n=1 Tax=Crocosphaera sp. UHCC 0190 TaxID=3110246 RepID=UPI002B21B785|nr:hybrid sensor histidine kinase/response regulator [Crocosphaera sp. UHCC 0190]MEA5511052.1 hybrid sensor histidine kinase/response regulator [Crocosphaera sp. UHCC 0190]
MTSRYSNPDTFADHSFDSDISQLLDDLGQELSPFESNGDLDELASLFDQEESEPLEDETPSRVTLSSLPSEDEINNLFSHDFTWEGESQTWDQASKPEEDEISSLLEKASRQWEEDRQEVEEADSSLFEDLTSAFEDLGEDSGLGELKDLLGGQDHEEAKVTSSVTVSLRAISDFYPALETLEFLLDQPPIDPSQDCLDEASAAELVALIEAPPMIAEAHPVAPTVTPPAITLVDVDDDLEGDDEFKDLEALLKEADRTMGGSPTLSPTKGQRPSTRPRSTKTKVFEQNMRVPVKQLDNLSNLIGELVVKRNRLEQDQERLRQFLDNLLNQVQNLSDVGGRMQDLYERTLLEGALLASRNQNRGGMGGYSPGNNSRDYNTSGAEKGEDQDLDALEMDRFTGFHLLSQEMIELIVRVRESSSDIQFLVDETEQVARSLRQVTTQLQEGMTKSRMVPFAQTADRLPRAIREISMKLHKKAKLQVEGRDVLIDKMILEQLYDPMTHLVNNAITHGIEDPAERQKQGKSPEGKIHLRAFLQGNQTVITVADDGGGIDAERVKMKAIEKDLITPEEATILTETEIYDFLFHPGFSTRDQADDFAGRGVGLDVVRTSLSDIRGSVTIDSVRGKGTTFIIRLPLTLSICKALCCVSNRARMAFPMDGVEDMKDYLPHDLITDETGQKSVYWNNQQLPVYSLGDLLSYNRQLSRGNVYAGKNEDDTISLVILRGAGNLLAIQVDQVIGEQEIVIKQIEGPIPKPSGIAGATVLGDGTIMPIGDVLELIEIAQGRLRTDGNSSLWKKNSSAFDTFTGDRSEPTVLIVDDSITVRELLSLSFSKSGYRVEQARDGQEAWEKLRSGLPCELVFCDIEMPRMNGLELLSQMQKDPTLSALPVALLTSRGADRHRKVAAKLGATAYFTKPCPDQTLLDAAQRMLNGEILLTGSSKKTKVKSLPVVKQQSKSSSPQSSTPSDVNHNVVLIIDDSVMVREMLSMSFTKAGYQIEQARDGQEAWEKLRGGLFCQLILCDIEMPRMTGLELLSRLKEDSKLSAIPIAMITSRGAQKMQRIAAERGAKGYFVKPYIEEVLLDAAKRLMAGEVLLDIHSLVEN